MSELINKNISCPEEIDNTKENKDQIEGIEEVEIEELAIDGICGVY
ncbi:MAG: variant-type mycofactocin precursor [Desulfobacterales bacterium]|nr:variant-type mycofactocin precursor [Desulfobacterales bacterium]MDD4072434.1 variant-type mycofactocin precursor [Desulfobacterales bacterium]MDD4392736.1 variant-type mycofactocin precursor [Desulfobacterales bacterium]